MPKFTKKPWAVQVAVLPIANFAAGVPFGDGHVERK